MQIKKETDTSQSFVISYFGLCKADDEHENGLKKISEDIIYPEILLSKIRLFFARFFNLK